MMRLRAAHINDFRSGRKETAGLAEVRRRCPRYLVELSLVLHGPHVASYGQLLRQLFVLGCKPFYDLLQGELQLPAVV